MGTVRGMRTTRALPFLLASGIAVLAPACSDEDGDGAVTDEEIQDVEDGVHDAGDQLDQEIDGQNEGDNENGLATALFL
jgi:hypothetical protein